LIFAKNKKQIMGLTIHYSGEFKRGASLSSMMEEVKDIAEVYDWKYHIHNDTFTEEALGKKDYSQEIYGISFTPTKCETVTLGFLSNGKMSSAMNLEIFGKKEDKPEEEYLYMLFVKTQFAGIEIHKLIIHLFKYLSAKYFTNFKVIDEGQYWETGDEKILQETFALYIELLDNFSFAFETYPKKNNEAFEVYFARLIDEIQKGRKK